MTAPDLPSLKSRIAAAKPKVYEFRRIPDGAAFGRHHEGGWITLSHAEAQSLVDEIEKLRDENSMMRQLTRDDPAIGEMLEDIF